MFLIYRKEFQGWWWHTLVNSDMLLWRRIYNHTWKSRILYYRTFTNIKIACFMLLSYAGTGQKSLHEKLMVKNCLYNWLVGAPSTCWRSAWSKRFQSQAIVEMMAALAMLRISSEKVSENLCSFSEMECQQSSLQGNFAGNSSPLSRKDRRTRKLWDDNAPYRAKWLRIQVIRRDSIDSLACKVGHGSNRARLGYVRKKASRSEMKAMHFPLGRTFRKKRLFIWLTQCHEAQTKYGIIENKSRKVKKELTVSILWRTANIIADRVFCEV